MARFLLISLLLPLLFSLASAARRKGTVNVVLLGATGNLAEKYLWQSLYNIFEQDDLSTGNQIHVFPAATKDASIAKPILHKILANNVTGPKRGKFFKQVEPYYQMKTPAQYEKMGKRIDDETSARGEKESGRLFYLSVPPKFFGGIAENIDKYMRPTGKNTWLRVIVEKPFGVDYESAQELAQGLYKSLKKEEILLVDHYMGKSGLHAIRHFVHSQKLQNYFKDRQISKVEVGMLETEDCGGRTGFYDEVGVVRDTMQNHLMMMVALLGMDTSKENEPDARKEFFQTLKTATLDRVVKMGQYSDYQSHVNADRAKWGEPPLHLPTKTVTYAHVTLTVDKNGHVLNNIPIHFKSGKALDNRRSYVEVHSNDGEMLVFNLQGKTKQGVEGSLVSATSNLPEFVAPAGWTLMKEEKAGHVAVAPDGPVAYEVLLRAGLEGKREHFVMLDEVLESWRVWTPLLEQLDSGNGNLFKYESGSAPHDHADAGKHDEL